MPAAPADGLLVRAAVWIAPRVNPTGAIYGLLSVAALLAAESGRHETYEDTVASAVIAACLYWLLHSYATVLGRRLSEGERLTPHALTRAVAYNRSLLRGAAVPVIALLVSWAAGATEDTAVTIALWTSIASLFLFELAAGLRARASASELALDAVVGVALGIGLLLVKVVLK